MKDILGVKCGIRSQSADYNRKKYNRCFDIEHEFGKRGEPVGNEP